jgi:hypothetical protein
MIRKTEKGLTIESQTTIVDIDEGHLASIRSAVTGEEFLDRSLQEGVPLFDLYHQNGKVSSLGIHPLASKLHYTVLADHIAEMVLNDWECDVSVRISIDKSTGDILLEPSAWTMQGGVAGVGMHIPGIREDLDLVAPFQQGFKGSLSHPQVQGVEADWPHRWEAAVVAFAGESSGFSVQSHDTHYVYKGVKIGHENSAQTTTFVTYARGPLEMNRCVGNVGWRISTYEGDWQTPFLQYRDWYWQANDLEAAAALRPEWLDGISLAVSWCPTNLGLLDALARKVDPDEVFLHLPHWRTSKYDQDYPTFVADENGTAFLGKAREMGFHVAPHTNHCQLSPDHPFFEIARDFCTRSPTDMRWGGWTWLPVEGWANAGPPQSYSTMAAVKDWNVLVNAHLAWSPWRRHLTREIAALIQEHGIDSVFVDVVHHVHNSDNATLENLSYAEGSLKLAREIAELAPGLCVAGEGRNEITTQYVSMVQFHLYQYAHSLAIDGKDISWLNKCTVPVSELIFKGLSRGIGYNYGKGDNRRLMIDTTLKQGAIPTLIFQTKDPVTELDGEECTYILNRADAL